jgi:hypothetical protein
MILVQNWPGLAMYRSLLFMKQPAKPGRPAIGNGPKQVKITRKPKAPPTVISIMAMGTRMITVMTTGIAMIIVIRTNTAMITGIRTTITTMVMITGIIIIMSTEKSMVTIK